MKHFVIFSAPRAGGDILANIINSHPDAVCHYELFEAVSMKFAPDSKPASSPIGSVAMRDWSPLSFVKRMWGAHDNAQAVGFTMPHRQHRLVFQTLLDDPDVKKLIVTRDDKLAMHVEGQRETQLKDRCDDSSIRVDQEILRKELDYDHDYYYELTHRLEKTKQKPLWIEYQKLQRSSTNQKLLGFLDLRFYDLSLPEALCENNYLDKQVANYQELTKKMPELVIP